jgi:hypothetical protein
LKDLKSLVGFKGSALVRLVSLFGQRVTESLMRMRSLLEQMAQPLVDLHVEEQGYPQDDSLVFLLRVPD